MSTNRTPATYRFGEFEVDLAVYELRCRGNRVRLAPPPLAPSPALSPAPERSANPARHNLPAELTSFVGRRQQLLELPRVLASSRCVSLVGAGGVGKTRLALRLARDLANEFSDGVWLVDLASLSAPDLVTQAIATAVGVRERPQRSVREALLDSLRCRELLLVLDNCVHL